MIRTACEPGSFLPTNNLCISFTIGQSRPSGQPLGTEYLLGFSLISSAHTTVARMFGMAG